MSDFIDFIHKEERANARSEEEKLALHKKQNRLREQVNTDEDDDFYNEILEDEDEDEMNEAVRVPYRHHRPAPTKEAMPDFPEEQEQERQYCVPKPTRQDIIDTDNDIKQYGVRPQKVKRELDFDPGFNESYRKPVAKARPQFVKRALPENPVLREAYAMMDGMKKKIEDMFYQYGMTGLEKLNESMLDVFEDILNPPVREVEPRIVERVVEVPAQPKVTVKKKVPKKKPVVSAKVIEEETEKPAKVIKEAKPIKQRPVQTPVMSAQDKQKAFESINNAANLSQLGNCLVAEETVQLTKGGKTTETLKKIQANAELIRRKEEESIKAQVAESTENEEPYEQPEEFDIVDDTDSTDINLETINTEQITDEEN